MPVTQDIRDAIERNDVAEAECLIRIVNSKHSGRGISGHDQQIFAAQIARIRALALAVEPEAEPEAAPEPKPKARKPARVVKVNQKTGDMEPA